MDFNKDKYQYMTKEMRENVAKIILADIDPIYFEVASRIDEDFPTSEFVPWCIAYKMSIEGAKVLLELPDEGYEETFEEFCISDKFLKRVTEKLGCTEQFIKDTLKDSVGNGEIFWEPTENGYYFPPRGLWVDAQMGAHLIQKMGPMYDAYQRVMRLMADQENWKMAKGRFKQRLENDVPMADARIMPRYDSVKDHPDLLPAENIKAILESKNKYAMTTCPCRAKNPIGDHKWDLEVCAATDRYADLLIRNGRGYELSFEELFEKLQKSGREVPMTHIKSFGMDLNDLGDVHCNCHHYACAVGRHTVRTGGEYKLWQVLQKSRYRAVIDETKCIGCNKCLKDRCMFDAILPNYYKSVGKELPYIFEVQCMGCGCCVETCPTQAIRMECVDPPEALYGYNYDAKGDPVFRTCKADRTNFNKRRSAVSDF